MEMIDSVTVGVLCCLGVFVLTIENITTNGSNGN
jgi:hypothetical protein